MALKLETYSNYDPYRTQDFFEERGWSAELVKVSNTEILTTRQGSLATCIDGRLAEIENQYENEGDPKLPGGINCVASMKTGGDIVGFNAAARELALIGFRAATHKDCGYYELWANGELQSVVYPLEVPRYVLGYQEDALGKWIALKNRMWDGKHVCLPKIKHEEEKLVLNAFIGTTPRTRKDRFGFDKWLLRALGVSEKRALRVVAETIELLAPHAKSVEILVK